MFSIKNFIYQFGFDHRLCSFTGPKVSWTKIYFYYESIGCKRYAYGLFFIYMLLLDLVKLRPDNS
jgi:hypothetical protein